MIKEKHTHRECSGMLGGWGGLGGRRCVLYYIVSCFYYRKREHVAKAETLVCTPPNPAHYQLLSVCYPSLLEWPPLNLRS